MVKKFHLCHIITFGSPCQNLFNIDKREGLTGNQSSLFYHAIRIIEEMWCANISSYRCLGKCHASFFIK
ncbi:DNA cytosine methyltransferase [Oceanobacillus profundus]|uniref:DNA cytosine methyltransferase n=1 Tax=Oceanobacillus profundus TaxID=372463 RepID=UPI0036337B3A